MSTATIAVDLVVNDNVSGFNPLNALVDFILSSPSGQQVRILTAFDFVFGYQSGPVTNATWRATLRMPQFSEQGFWTWTTVVLRDFARNSRTYSASDLSALGSAVQRLNVISEPSDTNPPPLTSLGLDR
jgi:hypothetical protein